MINKPHSLSLTRTHSRQTTERYAHLANYRLQRAASLIDKAYS
ncbi:hypothetical protein N9R89_01675 [bacterium]|nr:hypothetical protein [bacterium]